MIYWGLGVLEGIQHKNLLVLLEIHVTLKVIDIRPPNCMMSLIIIQTTYNSILCYYNRYYCVVCVLPSIDLPIKLVRYLI